MAGVVWAPGDRVKGWQAGIRYVGQDTDSMRYVGPGAGLAEDMKKGVQAGRSGGAKSCGA